MSDLDTLVAELPKNSSETLRVSLGTFNGHDLVHLRVWYQPKEGGEPRPGKAGVSLRVAMLPALHEAIGKAMLEAAGRTP
ncbi:MAG: transcriptional coactivator p15/PC4 family protein [Devosia sp.]|uniref:transcriptional coactivator p15/PC4 family protein n=1 Tax=Devosia sp. 66-22 TaxID=1895753 RepID=UPI0009260BA9|nr:transcriptional coactivator p15/PC4 family protein [Devosia sp. 66-22]MBN9347697.1 transcriptional coactivator p15/PC4 family protein [Devosia sp.]OJX51224.1 MAG: hypothetical protein BGO81_11080 [Devosia sp. 66-22]